MLETNEGSIAGVDGIIIINMIFKDGKNDYIIRQVMNEYQVIINMFGKMI